MPKPKTIKEKMGWEKEFVIDDEFVRILNQFRKN